MPAVLAVALLEEGAEDTTAQDVDKLMTQLKRSLEPSHRAQEDLLDLIHVLLTEARAASPPPAPQPGTSAANDNDQTRAGRLRLRDTVAAAAILGLERRTLEKWRVVGGGPRYCKQGGRVFYGKADMLEWLESHRYARRARPT